MKSILIAVGCDRYDALGVLSGAEADARKVFEVLTSPGQPYARDDSRLLLSPSKAELEQQLLRIGNEPLDVLTFYFAGHGGTKDGAYYFCMRDSRPERLSLSGYPLNAWLNLVRELKPRYAYLITDSCHSGGTHHDIREVLSDPRLGQNSASTFACLAAAASNQYAIEVGGAGMMTTELLKVLDGRLKAGSELDELDLIDVARVVGAQFEHLATSQRPVAWGLNLFGPGRLCRNPHHAKSDSYFHVPEVPVGSHLSKNIAAHSEELWELYRSVVKGIDLEKVRDLVRKVSGDTAISAEHRSAFVYGMAQAVAARLEARGTPWEAAETLGAFASFLLRDLGNAAAANTARLLLVRKLQMELNLFVPAMALLTEKPTALLNSSAPMADFYYLSQRLLKLLATVAQTVSVAPDFDLTVDKNLALAFIKKILAEYPLAVRAVCDDQAPPFFLWSHYARNLGWQEELELVFGCLCTDIVSIGGKIGRNGLPPRQACEYILARGRNSEEITQGWLANPGQLLAVCLLVASDNGLDAQVDPHLETLDHQKLNLYLPDDYATFADRVMEAGVNRTHAIGLDIWTCADFAGLFNHHWQQHMTGRKMPGSPLEQVIINVASMCFPDRVALSLRQNLEK